VDSSVLQIVVFRDGSPVGTEVFLPGEYTVGSDDGCELVLADEKVARTHARLTFREGRITLTDAGGGPNGVLVNGQPLSSAELKSRDDVAIGAFLLKFRIVGQKRAGAPAPPNAPAPSGRPAQPLASVRPATPASVPRQPRAGAAPRHKTPMPVPRQPSPLVGAAGARGTALAAASAARPIVAPPRPESDYAVTSTVAVPASLLQEATPAPEVELQPEIVPPPPAAAPLVPSPAKPPAPPLAKPERIAKVAAAPAPAPAPAVSGIAPGVAGALPQGPSLRVRVFWGRAMVGIHGFPFGKKVVAGPSEGVDVPLYDVPLKKRRFALARVEKGKWTVRVPPGLKVYRFERNGWKPASGDSERKDSATLIPLEIGDIVRMGDSRHSIEVRADRIPVVPRRRFREVADPQLYGPFGVLAVLGLIAMILAPQFKRDQADFTPRQLAPVRALLKPPEKKKPPAEKKKPEEKEKEKEKEKVVKPEKVPEPQPKPKPAAASQALKAVEKITVAGPAIKSLINATSKLTGGPKGYGDKGMGYKISPLIGKPPIAMAGMGFGPGAGGFGATKGFGSMRGMGNGEGGIGAFAAGGVGKGRVGGAVVSAPARKAEIRGQLDRELIAKVINDHMGEIRGCYERALLKETGLAGKLVLEWTIEPSGVVSEIRVKNVTLRGPEVPNCIIGSLRSWAFPKPKGGKVVVSYPFLFNSVGF
jgi:hypothetical protein